MSWLNSPSFFNSLFLWSLNITWLCRTQCYTALSTLWIVSCTIFGVTASSPLFVVHSFHYSLTAFLYFRLFYFRLFIHLASPPSPFATCLLGMLHIIPLSGIYSLVLPMLPALLLLEIRVGSVASMHWSRLDFRMSVENGSFFALAPLVPSQDSYLKLCPYPWGFLPSCLPFSMQYHRKHWVMLFSLFLFFLAETLWNITVFSCSKCLVLKHRCITLSTLSYGHIFFLILCKSVQCDEKNYFSFLSGDWVLSCRWLVEFNIL